MALRVIVVFASLFVVATLSAQEDDKQAAQNNSQTELDKLQGEWVLKSFEWSLIYTIKGNGYTFTQLDGKMTKVTFKIDATKEPKHFDWTPERGQLRLGIYKIEGDTLTICSNVFGNYQPRPTEFRAKANEWGITVWNRVKK